MNDNFIELIRQKARQLAFDNISHPTPWIL